MRPLPQEPPPRLPGRFPFFIDQILSGEHPGYRRKDPLAIAAAEKKMLYVPFLVHLLCKKTREIQVISSPLRRTPGFPVMCPTTCASWMSARTVGTLASGTMKQ